MTFKQALKNNLIFLDGAMGTQLQAQGLKPGELPEEWNITHPERVIAVHQAYLQAGSDVIYTNTFGANIFKFGDSTEEIIAAAVKNAKTAASGIENKFVALDFGSVGKLLKPLGSLGFEEAVSAYKCAIKAGVKAGADLIAIETMNDCYEMKAAIIAAKETCSLPIIATFVFGSDNKTMSGTSPEAAALLLEGLGVDALGVNCSLAPAQMKEVVRRMLAVTSLPVIVKPNAGLPEEVGGVTRYNLSARDFARDMKELAAMGARIVGGCCGTTPEYIKELKAALKDCKVQLIKQKSITAVCSYTNALHFGGAPVLIGERINPTGKKRLKQALKENDIPYILNEAISQSERGAHALDVNVGLPEIDERAMLARCVYEIQAVTDLPLQIDTSSPAAMEAAMRIYNGIPLVNSVNGTKQSMSAVFPLVKKYGGVVICLTLDENGIPATAQGRAEIAKSIISHAKKYGIAKNRLIFDTLATAVSADKNAALASIGALKIIKEKLGCNTSLGISNISYGLPNRDAITAAYFTLALGAGLSAAIYNPYSEEVQKAYKCFMALGGNDEGCADYIAFACSGEGKEGGTPQNAANDLRHCIVKGLKADAAKATAELIKGNAPLEVIDSFIIPALDEVGKSYEQKKTYLPQLLMSAEAAGAAFEIIKSNLKDGGNTKKTKFVIATVKGDIHDIGKNIVATLLKNYGFCVYDLGKDVPPESVVQAVKEHGAHIVGLSALMTTTVVCMKETVALLKSECPDVKICVGGAVLNEEYAKMIGADRYCKDAMDTVRFAQEIESIYTEK